MENIIGSTPILKIEENNIRLFLKLEGFNLTGSVKDRAAQYVIDKLLDEQKINSKTTIIESTSGNFGIALAAHCLKRKLKFISVVDPNIQKENILILKAYGAEIIMVHNADCHGGYLKSRINRIHELKTQIKNNYWINQYGNPLIWKAYYDTLGVELCREIGRIDYIFLGVSSGGTVAGVSRKVKERFPYCKVIAVDIEGSVIFGGKPQKRNIPGIGSSIIPDNLQQAIIDEVIIVSEEETIVNCRELLEKYGLLSGGSSGSVYAAIKKYFKDRKNTFKANVVAIFVDRGERYLNTIYNDEWIIDNNFKIRIKTNNTTEGDL